jgi:hypothetical protein
MMERRRQRRRPRTESGDGSQSATFGGREPKAASGRGADTTRLERRGAPAHQEH